MGCNLQLRLKGENLLDKLIQKTIEIAIENGIELGKVIIVDSTYTKEKFNQKSMKEVYLIHRMSECLNV